MGTAFVHSVIDDHSRVVYSEVHDDERTETAAAVLRRAVFWFLARGIVINHHRPTPSSERPADHSLNQPHWSVQLAALASVRREPMIVSSPHPRGVG
jgi:hypothetical protein